jgi:outer membrane biosynthesis protein TonB
MDRAEATGFGIATAGHLALLAALSLGFAATRIHSPPQQPIEVSFVEEAAPVSSAPEPSATPPAPTLAPVEGPPAPSAAPALPTPPQAQPLPPPPRPQPVHAAPAPAPAAHRPAPPKPAPPQARPAPAKPQARPTGRLSGLLAGLSDSASNSRSTAAPAASASAAVRSSLIAEIKRQLRPKWQQVVPSGADMDSLRTDVNVSLARDGSVTRAEVVRTTGVTPSNKPQVSLHQERAKKAVMLAAPFRLPAEYYDAWKQVTVTLDLRLSR